MVLNFLNSYNTFLSRQFSGLAKGVAKVSGRLGSCEWERLGLSGLQDTNVPVEPMHAIKVLVYIIFLKYEPNQITMLLTMIWCIYTYTYNMYMTLIFKIYNIYLLFWNTSNKNVKSYAALTFVDIAGNDTLQF